MHFCSEFSYIDLHVYLYIMKTHYAILPKSKGQKTSYVRKSKKMVKTDTDDPGYNTDFFLMGIDNRSLV